MTQDFPRFVTPMAQKADAERDGKTEHTLIVPVRMWEAADKTFEIAMTLAEWKFLKCQLELVIREGEEFLQ